MHASPILTPELDGTYPEFVNDDANSPDFNADCPICLRHRAHTLAEHEAALRRSYGEYEIDDDYLL